MEIAITELYSKDLPQKRHNRHVCGTRLILLPKCMLQLLQGFPSLQWSELVFVDALECSSLVTANNRTMDIVIFLFSNMLVAFANVC